MLYFLNDHVNEDLVHDGVLVEDFLDEPQPFLFIAHKLQKLCQKFFFPHLDFLVLVEVEADGEEGPLKFFIFSFVCFF